MNLEAPSEPSTNVSGDVQGRKGACSTALVRQDELSGCMQAVVREVPLDEGQEQRNRQHPTQVPFY